MTSAANQLSAEHFVTLFDNNFLPMGLCLHRSLLEHAQPFHLWVLCMDDLVECHLRTLALPQVSLIPLREVESEALLAVKMDRSRGEYCWTLTPFTAQFVFERDSDVGRVTYVDADVFFLASPRTFFDELEISKKHVLITEHAYDPRYDKTRRSGRFCVQFLTFRRTTQSNRVMRWWQDRCLEWCYDRVEDGKFGDQKYLDQWPILFANEVHVLQQRESTLAPWNVDYYERLQGGRIAPVFYHFHGFRLIAPGKLMFFSGYKVGKAGSGLYDVYLQRISEAIKLLGDNHISVPYLPLRTDLFSRLRRLKRRLFGGQAFGVLPQ